MKYGKRSLWKKIISSPLVLFCLIIVFIILARATWGIFEKTSASYESLSRAQEELKKLEVQKTELADKIGYLSTEQGIEAELRTKYKAIKDGESVAVIIDRQPGTTTATMTASISDSESIVWWRKVLQAIGL